MFSLGYVAPLRPALGDDALLLVFGIVRSVAARGPVVSRMAGVVSARRRDLVDRGRLLLLRRWTGRISG